MKWLPCEIKERLIMRTFKERIKDISNISSLIIPPLNINKLIDENKNE